LVAISPSHLFISRLATYDAVCFLFLAASLDALSYAYARRSLPAAALASGLMALAALAKYPAAACAAVGALALLGAPRLCLVFVGGLGATLGLYGFLERGELAVLVERQLLGTHQPNATSAEVLLTALAYLWPWLLLGLLGLIEAAPAWRLRAAVLASGAVPLVAYHLHGLNLISLYKHLVFSVLFLSPAAALALARLGKQGARGLLVAALVTLAVAVQSAVQVRAMEQAFPDVRPAIEVLERHVGPRTRILSEDPYLPRYVFAGRLDADQIAETTWFDADGDGTRSDADVAEALESGRFDLVLLTGAVSPKLHDLLAGGVLESRYERLYSQPFVATAVMNRQRFGFLEIYRRRGCRNCTAAMRTFMSEHDSSLGEGARDPWPVFKSLGTIGYRFDKALESKAALVFKGARLPGNNFMKDRPERSNTEERNVIYDPGRRKS
ncbi:MAG: hypothetical protein AAF725_15905, partial [Acidobacteriota bacterium]